MTNWLDFLPRELELAEVKPGDPFEPNHEIGENDHSVGVIEDGILKKMYILAVRWKKEAAQLAVDASFTMDKEKQSILVKKAYELRDKGEVLLHIFWVSVKEAFKLWGMESIGIRKGWKVVWTEEDTPPFLNILGQLFGGD